MAITFKNLVAGSQLTTSTVIYYSADNAVTGVINNATVTNTTGGAATFTIYLVPDGGAADATHEVIAAKSVAAGATDTCEELLGKNIEALGTLRAKASNNAVLTFMVSGIELS